ncbi:fatty acyl-CoA reductase 2, chloroplastic-like isoform X2 [Solanum lycopersicum]|uniref:fatty acyl-CoA reductase 2, chloroplastic-like isoform X2 n=1 Tax=Solanum lycopersicum TaxID=4081 RepID=UPI000276C6DA|nr:fatty acyl-CoA reductase 2-like isoform X2 [Solanum lycopersicum]
MLLSKNNFPLYTRESPTKLFSKNNFSSSFDKYKIVPSFKYEKRSMKNITIFSSPNNQHFSLKVVTNAPSIIMDDEKEIISQNANNGIGIVEFFEGKNILVTGGTGFLAKALIEKMLRTTPKINKIYILIRAKDKEAAFNRLKSEIIESELFKCLEEIHGEYYKPFILNKLIPIVGNIYEPNLGMDIITSQQIAQQIDLIIDSAANTTFDERYDLALDANVNGPYQLMMFAKKCKNLKLLMHYSTAYANGEREGLILEKPFSMGESITKEKINSISPFTNFPSLHVDNEIDLISKLKNNITNNIGLEQIMKNLGVERVIDPSIFLYGKGELPAIYCDQDTDVDLIPVDVVVNATMAAIAKHGYLQSPQLNVYHLATTLVNPVAIHQLFDYCYEYFTLFPFVNSKGDKIEVKEMKYFDKISDFSNYIWEVLSKQHKVQDLSEKELLKIHMRFKRKVEFLNNFSKLYEPYGFYRGRFHTGNMRILMEEMSEEERKNFEIDASNINWKDYLTRIHISGVKKHVFEGKKLPI